VTLHKNLNKKTLIIGAGKVGVATGEAVGGNVDYHDPHKGILNSNYNLYEYLVVCVDTVQAGPADYKDLDNVLADIEKAGYQGIVVIRSTISPLKIKEIDGGYSFEYILFPEFMPQQDGKLIIDKAWIAVLGGDKINTFAFAEHLKSLGYPAQHDSYRYVTKEEACIIKLSNNAGLSAKLIYFNAIYKICEKFGVSYEVVRDAIGMDSRIGIGHSIVPSPDDGKFGFGGHCLPKDILAISEIDDLGYFESVAKINKKLRNI